MKRIATIASMVVLLAVVGATAALGATFTIPIDTVIRTDPGVITPLASEQTPPELVGASCVGLAVARNQDSVHPNNDILISSDGSQAVIADVEGAPNQVTEATGTIILGETVDVALRMGPDGVFSGGLDIVIDTNCTPATTTTTTVPPAQPPAIQIVKDANPVIYEDNTGEFTITVTNPGPVDLINVVVTDSIEPQGPDTSDCARDIGDLAVGEDFTYSCTVPGLDGVSPYVNTATVIGTDREGTEVTDTDPAEVFPVAGTTVTTQAPTTTQAPGTTEAPTETLPVTGISNQAMRGFSLAGLAFLLIGVVMLSGAAVVGQYRSRG